MRLPILDTVLSFVQTPNWMRCHILMVIPPPACSDKEICKQDECRRFLMCSAVMSHFVSFLLCRCPRSRSSHRFESRLFRISHPYANRRHPCANFSFFLRLFPRVNDTPKLREIFHLRGALPRSISECFPVTFFWSNYSLFHVQESFAAKHSLRFPTK